MSKHSPFEQPATEAEMVAHIRRMADSFEPDEIATMMRIPQHQVTQALETLSHGKWWGRCNRTGRIVTADGQRGIYRRVCTLGWVDWSWGVGKIGEGVQP